MDSDTPDLCPRHGRKPLKQLRRRLLDGGSISLLAGLVWFIYPRPIHMRQFDPQTTAKIEGQLWRDIYQKDRLGLISGLYQFGRDAYGFSPISAARLAWYSARAAVDFQSSKTRSEARCAIPNLVNHFEGLQRGSGSRFVTTAAAEAILEWWQ
jgi:hypothetical protein